MNAAQNVSPGRGLASLKRFASKQPVRERCEVCSAPVGSDHAHLVDPQNRRILCACQACAILFDEGGVTKYRRIPREVRELAMEMSDAFWSGLAIPIGLVFFFRSTAPASIMALYPSPAGPTETSLDEDAWREMIAMHPSIGTMRPDVEALLVNRIKDARAYYIVPIDECYKLVGLIRQHWSGLSGGDKVWQELALFFDSLKQRSRPERNPARA